MTSDLQNLLGSPNVTSSPASESGHIRSVERDGQITVLSGQDLARANLSARQAEEKGLLMSGTCGPIGSTSSISIALQKSLASRYQARTALVGSTLYKLTWKERVTPLGRKIVALRASGRRTSVKDSTSSQPEGGGLTDWPTPRAAVAGPDYAIANRPDSGGISLATAAALSNWDKTVEVRAEEPPGDQVNFGSWNTPRASDGSNGGPNQGGGLCHLTLASHYGWATPAARDYRGANARPWSERGGGKKGEQLPNQVFHLLRYPDE